MVIDSYGISIICFIENKNVTNDTYYRSILGLKIKIPGGPEKKSGNVVIILTDIQ